MDDILKDYYRENHINNLTTEIKAEKLFKRFDDIGCFYLNLKNFNKNKESRLYRRNNTYYLMSTDRDVTYLYNDNIQPMYEDNLWDEDVVCVHDPKYKKYYKYISVEYLLQEDKSLSELLDSEY